MQTFKRRPLAVFFFVFIFISLLSLTLAGFVKIIIFSAMCFVTASLIIVYIFNKKKPTKLMFSFICSAFALLAVCQSYLYFDKKLLGNNFDGDTQTHTVIATVRERESNTDFYTKYTVELKTIDGKKTKGKMLLECEYVCALAVNETFSAELSVFSLNKNPDAAYNRSSLISDGYLLYGISDEEANYNVLETAPDNIKAFFKSINELFSSKLTNGIKGEAGGLTAALLLGNKYKLNNSVIGDFRRVGISHILSLSGMHMSIIIGAFELFLRKLYVHKKIRCVVVSVAALSYLAITGFHISAVRSVFMILAVYLCYCFASEGDSVTALFVIIGSIILITPYAICDLGMWLSFLATFGILVTAPHISAFCNKIIKPIRGFTMGKKVIRYLVSGVLITFVATPSISVITCCFFKEFAILSPLANIIIIPLTYLLLVFSLMYLVLSAVPVVNVIIVKIIQLLANTILRITDNLAHIKGGVVNLDYWFVKLVVVAMVLLLLISLFINIKRKVRLLFIPITAVVIIIASISVFQYINRSQLNVIYLKNKVSEEIVLTSRNKAVICDFSDGSSTNLNFAYNTVCENHVCEIEVLILSHYHEKHKTSFRRLNEKTVIRNLWLPEPLNEKEYYIMLDLIKTAEKERVVATIYNGSEELFVFNDVKIEYATHKYIKRSTHPTLMMRIMKSDTSLMYIGGSFHESENYELANLNIKNADYVIFGVHGPVIKSQMPYSFVNNKAKYILAANLETVQAFYYYDENYKEISIAQNIIVDAEKFKIIIK